jgi:hypothetical protein
MQGKTLLVIASFAIIGTVSAAMARGGGGGAGVGWHGGGGHAGHNAFGRHFNNRFGHFGHQFQRNQVWYGDGWGWGPYGDNGYGNTTVLAFPQALPKAADVTGSIAATPCHWNAETFTVPSSDGGTRPVQVVSCR